MPRPNPLGHIPPSQRKTPPPITRQVKHENRFKIHHAYPNGDTKWECRKCGVLTLTPDNHERTICITCRVWAQKPVVSGTGIDIQMRTKEQVSIQRCKYCGRQFTTKNPAQTCGATHRKAWSRLSDHAKENWIFRND